jgi:threonine dehydrogenase-like Zn-dependent dehydrogenase
VTHQEAAIAEPLSVAIHAVHRIGTAVDGSVAILGAGTIGLASVVAAREAGADRIFVTDIADFNLEVASRLGASLTVNTHQADPVAAILKATGGRGVDVVLIAVGFSSVFNQAIGMVRPKGKVVTIALFDDVVTIEKPNALVMGEKTITSSWGETPQDFKRSIEIIASGRVRVEEFVTHRLPLEKTKEGLELLEKRHEDCIKILLEIG